MSVDTAILFFYQDSNNESKKGVDQVPKLFDALNDHLINKLSHQPIDLILFDESKQRGNDFGTRYQNALDDAFSQGYKKIISIGNDTPQLSFQHILKADAFSEKGKTVIGPSFDGGFYLWALHRDDFQQIDFQKINWQTRHVFAQLKDQLNTNGIEIGLLKCLTDIDDFQSLKQVINRLAQNNPLKKILQLGLVTKDNNVLKKPKHYTSTHYLAHFFNKGPPDLIFPIR